MRKKAIMETQFAWIFILVVGAVILVFFVSVSKSQRESAEIKSSGVFSKEFDAILAGVGISVDTSHKLYLPRIDILMDCDTFTTGYISNNLDSRIVFAPQQIKGDALVAWTLSWDMPFKVTNFIFLTGSDMRYVIFNNQELFDELPDELFKQHMNPSDTLTDLKNYRVKFIFVDKLDVESSGLPSNLLSNNKNEITAVNFKPGDNEVEFYVLDSDKLFELAGVAPYFGDDSFGKASKYAAIFAEDKEFYSCSMEKAFERLKFISYIHYRRAEELKSLSFSLCEAPAWYGSASLKDIYDTAVFTSPGIDDLKTKGGNIESNNKKLMQNGCPPIY